MKHLLNVYKPVCLTPLQVIDMLRVKSPEYKDVKIGYAGRLDPLAHGVLLLMIGDAAKQREKYLNLPKEYEFEAVFGVETDTYDLLGLLQNKNDKNVSNFDIRFSDLTEFAASKLGAQTQKYPPFSSKTVEGKPLYWWTKENKLSEIKIPEKEVTISSFELLLTGEITSDDLHKKIIKNVTSIQGDFRQKEILERWGAFFNNSINSPLLLGEGQGEVNSQFSSLNSQFRTARFRIFCSSGTYVRGLVHEMGQKLGTGATATEILRTKVGEHAIEASLRLQ